MEFSEIKSQLSGHKHRVSESILKEIAKFAPKMSVEEIASELGYRVSTVEGWFENYGEFAHYDHPGVARLRKNVEAQRAEGKLRLHCPPDFQKNLLEVMDELKLPIGKMSRLVDVDPGTIYGWMKSRRPVSPVSGMSRQEPIKTVERKQTLSVTVTVPAGTKIVLPSGHTLAADDYAAIKNC